MYEIASKDVATGGAVVSNAQHSRCLTARGSWVHGWLCFASCPWSAIRGISPGSLASAAFECGHECIWLSLCVGPAMYPAGTHKRLQLPTILPG